MELKEFKTMQEAKEFLTSQGYFKKLEDILFLIEKEDMPVNEPIKGIFLSEIKEKAKESIFIKAWNNFLDSVYEEDKIYLSDYPTAYFLIASLVRELKEIKEV